MTHIVYKCLRIFTVKIFLILFFNSSLYGQFQDPDNYTIGVHFGLTKSIKMEAQTVGAGKHLGFDGFYKMLPYLSTGGGFTYTHIEGILMNSETPFISLGMLQGKLIARFKTPDNERNVYGFMDISPGYSVDITPNNPKDSGYQFKNYWGPMLVTSVGTVMGTGMLKLSLENLLLDNELITWFSLSLGVGI